MVIKKLEDLKLLSFSSDKDKIIAKSELLEGLRGKVNKENYSNHLKELQDLSLNYLVKKLIELSDQEIEKDPAHMAALLDCISKK